MQLTNGSFRLPLHKRVLKNDHRSPLDTTGIPTSSPGASWYFRLQFLEIFKTRNLNVKIPVFSPFPWLLACKQPLCLGMGSNRIARRGKRKGDPFLSLSSRFFHPFPKQSLFKGSWLHAPWLPSKIPGSTPGYETVGTSERDAVTAHASFCCDFLCFCIFLADLD